MKTNIQDLHFYGEIKIEIEKTEEKMAEVLKRYPLPTLPEGNNSVFNVEDYNPGDKVKDVLLLINDFSVETASNGNPFLKLSFINNNGSVGAKMWDNKGSVFVNKQLLEEHSVFIVSGKIEQFPKDTGSKTITIDSLKVYGGEVQPFEMLPSTAKNMEDLVYELHSYLEEFKEPYRSIAFYALDKYWSEFVMKPAAMGHHHAYLGGLLKHTIGLMRIGRYMMKSEHNPYVAAMKLVAIAQRQYNKELWDNVNAEVQTKPRKMVWNGSIDHLNYFFHRFTEFREVAVNTDILMLSILYHDMGKIHEYSHVGEDAIQKFKWLFPTANLSSLENRRAAGIYMDELGKSLGHIPVGVMLFKKDIEDMNLEMDILDIIKISNCILSHHGKMEWGSPSLADYPEAVLIHFVDYLDSRWESADPIK